MGWNLNTWLALITVCLVLVIKTKQLWHSKATLIFELDCECCYNFIIIFSNAALLLPKNQILRLDMPETLSNINCNLRHLVRDLIRLIE